MLCPSWMSDKPDKGRQSIEDAFREHGPRIYRYLLRRTTNHADAEDLTQSVFADAAAALSRSGEPDALLALLYTVAERRFIDYVRRRRRFAQTILDEENEPAGELSYGPTAARALRDAVQRLSSEDQQVVVMRLFQGTPFAEIARQRGSSEAAVKMRFSRALGVLRADLRKQGLEP